MVSTVGAKVESSRNGVKKQTDITVKGLKESERVKKQSERVKGG